MLRMTASKPMRPIALLLVLVGLLFASAVDAAVCEPEGVGAENVAAVQLLGGDEQQGETQPDDPHGVCSHGHCHHSAQVMAASDHAGYDALFSRSFNGLRNADLSSITRALPKPPPRV